MKGNGNDRADNEREMTGTFDDPWGSADVLTVHEKAQVVRELRRSWELDIRDLYVEKLGPNRYTVRYHISSTAPWYYAGNGNTETE